MLTRAEKHQLPLIVQRMNSSDKHTGCWFSFCMGTWLTTLAPILS